jgi:hypothetical protein
MLSAMERDQFNNELKRSNKLGDFIMNDQSLLVELIGSADLEVIKDLTRALQLSPCFDDMDKRSLLARIVKTYPAVQSLISGEATKQETALLVSWESLERRKNEYTELVQKKIPANSKEIAIAAKLRRPARKSRIQSREGNAERCSCAANPNSSSNSSRPRYAFYATPKRTRSTLARAST